MIENIHDEKILVTGGTGFLGGYVVEELISKGLTPTVLTRNRKMKVFDGLRDKINFDEIDLLDFSAVRNYIAKFRPDRIIHLAGYVYRTSEQPGILEKSNFEATVNLLEAAASAKVKRIVITGTADEYGFQNCPQIETMSAMPVSEYAVSKNKAVNYALAANQTNGLPVVITRPFTIYGIGQPAKMFVSQAIEAAVGGVRFEMSRGEQKRDLLFVTDFVNAIIKLLTADGIEGEIFNLGSGQSVALKEVAKKIWEIAGANERLLRIGARPTGESELYDTQADVSKIKRMLDWKPKVSLDDGLKLIIEKAKKNLQ